MLLDPLEVELASGEPPPRLGQPVVVVVADEPDRVRAPSASSSVPRPAHRPADAWWATHSTVPVAVVAVDHVPVVGHLMECPGVDAEPVRHLAQGVVAGAGDHRPEVDGIVRDHEFPVGHEQPGEPLAVAVVGRGAVLGGQRHQLLDGRALVERSAGRGHDRSVTPAGDQGEPLGEGRHLVVDLGQVVAHRGRDHQTAPHPPTGPRRCPAPRWSGGSRTGSARWTPGRARPPRPTRRSWAIRTPRSSAASPSGWKPSPRRPARRAAASLWPPMWMGTPPGRTGLG